MLVVLLLDAALTTIRGLVFVGYLFAGSKFALVAVVWWLGLSALSVFLLRRFRDWAAGGFPRTGRAIATVVYAYTLLGLAVGLTLEHLAGLVGIDWLETGGDEPNHVFTAVGLTVTGIALVLTVLTILRIRTVKRRATLRGG